MTVSKAQKIGVLTTCICGCGEQFTAFPLYDQGKGKGLRTPEYKRGHHPNCRKTQLDSVPVWNKGLTKTENDTVGRQGKKAGQHWRFDPEQNPDWFAIDFDFRDFAAKFGVRQRSKGCNKAYAKFRLAIMTRDSFTCQDCGMIADENEETDLLQVHHIVFVKHDRTRMFDPTNVTTLCYPCHRKHHRKINKKAAP